MLEKVAAALVADLGLAGAVPLDLDVLAELVAIALMAAVVANLVVAGHAPLDLDVLGARSG